MSQNAPQQSLRVQRELERAQRELELQQIWRTQSQNARNDRYNARAQRVETAPSTRSEERLRPIWRRPSQYARSTGQVQLRIVRVRLRIRRNVESSPSEEGRWQFRTTQARNERSDRESLRSQEQQASEEQALEDQALERIRRIICEALTQRRRRENNEGNLVKKIFENCNGTATTSTEECRICMKNTKHPIGCTSCKKLVGCFSCCKQWAQSSMERAGKASCPLCRGEWTTNANVEELMSGEE